MTIEQILDLPADDLSKISDEQYLKWFEEHGYLNVTRPERAPRKHTAQQEFADPAKQAQIRKLAEVGIDLSWLTQKKKR